MELPPMISGGQATYPAQNGRPSVTVAHKGVCAAFYAADGHGHPYDLGSRVAFLSGHIELPSAIGFIAQLNELTSGDFLEFPLPPHTPALPATNRGEIVGFLYRLLADATLGIEDGR